MKLGEWLIGAEKKVVKGHIDIPEFSFGELDDLQVHIIDWLYSKSSRNYIRKQKKWVMLFSIDPGYSKNNERKYCYCATVLTI